MDKRVAKTVVLSALGLGAAAGGPPLLQSGAELAQTTTSQWTEAWNRPAEAEVPLPATTPLPPGRPLPLAPDAQQPPLEGPAHADLAQIFSYEVTPGWVLSHWARVFTNPGSLDLMGYRVPLVTGTEEEDLAGSLTYYFDPRQRVQRITFYGSTANPRRLISVLAERHGFVRRLLNDPGLYQFEVPDPLGQPRSVLRFRSAPIVRADCPYERFQIQLVMERPGR